MSETIEATKVAAQGTGPTISPVEMLKQAVTGAGPAKGVPSETKASVAARTFRFGTSARLATASTVALGCGLVLGLLAAPAERSGEAVAQLHAELTAARMESGRLAQEMDRLVRTTAALREASEAARAEAKAWSGAVSERIARSEQNLEKRLASVSEAVARVDRDVVAALAQSEKKAQPVAAVMPKTEVKPDTRAAEPTQTGSLPDKSKSDTLENWALRDVYDGVAVLEDRRRRLVEVGRGDTVPGVGRVEAIERRGRQWVVITRQGVISPQTW